MRVVCLLAEGADLELVLAGAALGPTTAMAALPDETAGPLLAQAQRLGATSLVQIWDEVLRTTDFLGRAAVLAATVRTLFGADSLPLVLAADRGRGAVGPAVAERLDLPLLGQVLQVERREDQVVAARRTPAGVRGLAVRPPALLCLIADSPPAVEPASDVRTHSFRSLAEIGMSAAEIGYRRHFAPSPLRGPQRQARRFADVAALCRQLRAEGLVPAAPVGRRKRTSSRPRREGR